MARYWIAPVEKETPLSIGEDRLLIDGCPDWEALRVKLQRVHPWLLPMVKAHILSAGPEDDGTACGSETGPVYHAPGPISFDGEEFQLSECGRAFIDRLPSHGEQRTGLNKAVLLAGEENWTMKERAWLEKLGMLVDTQRKLFLVRED
jgi:hypothetical protein